MSSIDAKTARERTQPNRKITRHPDDPSSKENAEDGPIAIQKAIEKLDRLIPEACDAGWSSAKLSLYSLDKNLGLLLIMENRKGVYSSATPTCHGEKVLEYFRSKGFSAEFRKGKRHEQPWDVHEGPCLIVAW